MKNLILFIFGVMSSLTFSQACGEGGYSVTVYCEAPSGDTIWYELLPVRVAALDSLYPDAKIYYESQAIQVSTEHAEGILGDTKDHKRFLEISKALKNSTSGMEEGMKGQCTIGFRTYELNSTPYLLRLHDGDKEVNIVSSFMGGCNSRISINWAEGRL